MPHIDAAIDEIGRALDELGMTGVTMNTSVLDRALTEAEFEPVFAELDRRGAVLYLHPVGNGACSPLVSQHHLTWMVGAPFEDTIVAMQLITAGHLQRYPSIRIICSHLGGALPMLTRRADDHLKWEAPDTPEAPSLAVRRLWYDTVSHCHVPALRCAIETFGADRIVLGTDFPYEDGETFVRAVAYVAMPPTPSNSARFWRATRWRCSVWTAHKTIHGGHASGAPALRASGRLSPGSTLGALVGWLIFTKLLGIGDEDIFDFGGIIGAIIGTLIVLPIAGYVLNRTVKKTG